MAVTIVATIVKKRNAPPAQFSQERICTENATPEQSTQPMVQNAHEWAERGRKGNFCYADFNGADLGGVNLGPGDETGKRRRPELRHDARCRPLDGHSECEPICAKPICGAPAWNSPI